MHFNECSIDAVNLSECASGILVALLDLFAVCAKSSSLAIAVMLVLTLKKSLLSKMTQSFERKRARKDRLAVVFYH